ncbi:DUF4381 domain-containing protein [Polycladidibacter stylochi]|uniref:DUF4381 domain-containing protein n=1 Tax=Polycladidibacter stylochi TaxID=1807766 RepID=UPI00082D8F97|nr:DUF4381 domain-containing protein [Pseudovibrio stylochi]
MSLSLLEIGPPDVFGNYLLKEIEPIVLPSEISWWPATALAWFVLLLLSLSVLWFGWRLYRNWRRNRYRRLALRQLNRLGKGGQEPPIAVSSILKVVAIHAYGRATVAALTGMSWVDFLNKTGRKQANFDNDLANYLQNYAYAPLPTLESFDGTAIRYHLIKEAKKWVKHHREGLC